MVRLIALTKMLGALAAAGILYAASQPGWRNGIGVGRETSEIAETKVAIEDWPICTSMGTIGSDADWAELDRDFAAGKRALAAEDWNAAITVLKLAASRDPYNADIANYIGYAYWRLRQTGPALGHFQQALMFNPRHRGAHEHLGELFLALREPARADEHLGALERICLVPCEEFGELKRAITAYRHSATRDPAASFVPNNQQ